MIRLAFLTTYDPPGSGEGTLDPLGLYMIADQLATRLVPAVRERMQRVRFLTAMAIGGLVTEGLDGDPDQPEAQPSLIWEWLVVEAIIRSLSDDPRVWGVPGTLVTRRALAEYKYLDHRSYLKTPRIFGFHGVYKRLAIRLSLVDVHLGPRPESERLAKENGREGKRERLQDRWSRTPRPAEILLHPGGVVEDLPAMLPGDFDENDLPKDPAARWARPVWVKSRRVDRLSGHCEWLQYQSWSRAASRVNVPRLERSGSTSHREIAMYHYPPIVSLLLVVTSALGAGDSVSNVPGRRPREFAIIYNMGYAGDHLPAEPADFEKLILACREAHYNVVLCKYTDRRAEICRKHGMKIMVDLLVEDHHVYRNLEGARALCESLRDSDVVYAYHLWSDRVGGTVAGRNRDINNVRRWDPNHAAYVGDYHARAIGALQSPDIIGYYDFHWKRLGHFRHLHRAWAAAQKTNAPFLKYADPAPGRVGIGNYNRVLYTISTSIAFGLKGYTYHYVGGIDTNAWRWQTLGEDLKRVNAEVAALGPELMKIGLPTAVYSTPITKTAKDRPTGSATPTVPAEFKPIPEDHWVLVTGGEAIVGVFKDDERHDTLFFANHNCYQTQPMELKFNVSVTSISRFNRQQAKWVDLARSGRRVHFDVPSAAGELIRVVRK